MASPAVGSAAPTEGADSIVLCMVTIREATADDFSGLVRLRAAWASEQDPTTSVDPHFEDAFLSWMEANPRTFFVAEHGNQLVGMLNLLVTGKSGESSSFLNRKRLDAGP